MKAFIVFESMFGNTETFARDIAAGLASSGAEVAVADVRHVQFDDLRNCDLLVVGAPTHAFSLSRESTRQDAVRQGADPSHADLGAREWLGGLTELLAESHRPTVSVFDTRVEKVRRLPGSAARRAAKLLRAQGFEVMDLPTSFFVEDVKGPLAPGERARARAWGEQLARHAAERITIA